MKKKSINQAELFDDAETIKICQCRKQRIVISQVSFLCVSGLSFTAVKSRNFQRHAERLATPISFTVPTVNDQALLRRLIRAKALVELSKQKNEK